MSGSAVRNSTQDSTPLPQPDSEGRELRHQELISLLLLYLTVIIFFIVMIVIVAADLRP